MASAVAAPIPRLAPVTTATRPASQCTGSPPAISANHLLVEPLVSVQAAFQVEMPLGVVAAGRTRNPRRPPDGVDGGLDVIGRYQETGHAVRYHLTECPAANRHAGPGSSRADLLPAVLGVIGVAVDVDRYSGRAGDVDGLGGALLGTQPAREHGAIPGSRRPGDGAGGHVGREDRIDADDPAPDARFVG